MSKVDWKKVACCLGDAMAANEASGCSSSLQGNAALLAYRLACELDAASRPQWLNPKPIPDPTGEAALLGHTAFNCFTAQPRVGDRVRLITRVKHGPDMGKTGEIRDILKDFILVDFNGDGVHLRRNEFAILPRDKKEGQA